MLFDNHVSFDNQVLKEIPLPQQQYFFRFDISIKVITVKFVKTCFRLKLRTITSQINVEIQQNAIFCNNKNMVAKLVIKITNINNARRTECQFLHKYQFLGFFILYGDQTVQNEDKLYKIYDIKGQNWLFIPRSINVHDNSYLLRPTSRKCLVNFIFFMIFTAKQIKSYFDLY